MEHDEPGGELLVPHRYWPENEDCQNLNIWSTDLSPDEKKPVVVWIHGGGYTAGSSIEQVAYDGFNMCKLGNVVVVSVNHRLNILGYLDLSPFGEKYANSANAGHADLVAALKWIHENIRNFGGDPENVTIFGQSGGGFKCGELMQIPEADGLFHKVLIMSGVSDGMLLPNQKGDGRAIVTALLKELNITEDEIEKLEIVPYYRLAEAYERVSPIIAKQGYYVGCSPMPNEFFVGEPLEGLREHAKTIPLMVGSVFAEFGGFARNTIDFSKMTEKDILDAYTEKYGEYAPRLLELFKKTYSNHHPMDLFYIDYLFRKPSKQLARQHARYGKAPSYCYMFSLNFPIQYGKTSWHCADIPFFFHNTDKVELANIPGISDKLEDKIFKAFMQFVYTGDPSTEELTWPKCMADDAITMVFDEICETRNHFDDELIELYEKVTGPVDIEELFQLDIQH